jgi:DNA-binding GntR family transcriptional regulator
MPKSLRERIYQILRDDITYGKLTPGERLVEDDLSRRFRASRTPVREALRQLESEGQIYFQRNKGIIVSKLTLKDVEELYGLRWVLESYAAHLAAERPQRNGVVYLKSLQKMMAKAAKDRDSTGWFKANALFHDFFSENSGHSHLTQQLELIKRKIYRFRYIALFTLKDPYIKSYLKDHERIIEGYTKGDGRMVEKYMKHHLGEVKKLFIAYLSNLSLFK